MKGAMASVEIWAVSAGSAPRRLSLVLAAPERAPDGVAWHCRVALADLHRPQTVAGRDSVEALLAAVGHARGWIEALQAEGHALFRDRGASEPFSFP